MIEFEGFEAVIFFVDGRAVRLGLISAGELGSGWIVRWRRSEGSGRAWRRFSALRARMCDRDDAIGALIAHV